MRLPSFYLRKGLDAYDKALVGIGHGYYTRGRDEKAGRVFGYPYDPKDCWADVYPATWNTAGTELRCAGCGLDCI